MNFCKCSLQLPSVKTFPNELHTFFYRLFCASWNRF